MSIEILKTKAAEFVKVNNLAERFKQEIKDYCHIQNRLIQFELCGDWDSWELYEGFEESYGETLRESIDEILPEDAPTLLTFTIFDILTEPQLND